MAEIILSEKDIRRFWSKVDRRGPDECWEWMRSKDGRGYGSFYYGGIKHQKTRASHRVSYHLAFGLPDDLFVCHRCDNPGCVNPAHLFLGTHADNMRDMTSKGRQNRGDSHYASLVTEAQALEIRSLAAKRVHYSKIGASFGVDPKYVSAIATGRSWKHLGPPIYKLKGWLKKKDSHQ